MNPDSNFWLGFVYFLLQVILTIVGIWIAVVLYLRQQQKELNEKNEMINSRLREISRELAEIKGKLEIVDRSTSDAQRQLLETQSRVILHFTEYQVKTSELVPQPIDSPRSSE